MKYDIHPDFAKLKISPRLTPGALRMSSHFMKLMLSFVRVPKDVAVRRMNVIGYKGLPVPTEIYMPKERSGKLPCLLYFHGGAFCFSAAPYHKQLAIRYARETGCAVALPDYHLLPEFPLPAALQDSVAAVDRILESADEYDIDVNRVAVGGDSAGAVLAAAVCAHAAVRIRFQMLLYPVTDAMMQTESMRRYTDTPVWNSTLNAELWSMYLKGIPKEQWQVHTPMHALLPERVPDTYIETAEFDCLHDDGILYAERLRAAGGKVTVFESKGTVHGYDMILNSKVTEDSVRRRIEALKEAFGKG